jgi:hypothetical protein
VVRGHPAQNPSNPAVPPATSVRAISVLMIDECRIE